MKLGVGIPSFNVTRRLVQIVAIKRMQIKINENDPGIVKNTGSVKEYFAAYPYIVELPWRDEIAIDTQLEEIKRWCEETEIVKFAHNILRVGRDNQEHVFRFAGGDNIWFWAFTNEKDAMMFTLKWV